MVRRNRVFLPYGVYHVYCRVSRGEYVFNRDEDASAFVAAVRWMIEADGLSVLAWALLSNHYHLVVRTAEIPLWRSMLRFQPRVTRGHNRRRQIFGPLWQDRYRARIVLNDKYYRQVIAYVHLNPVAAGLASDPADWIWSGHGALIGTREPVLVNPEEALVGFDANIIQARCRYLEYIRNVAEERWAREGVRNLPWWKKAKEDRQLVAENEIPDKAVTWKGEPAFCEVDPPELNTLLELCSVEAGCPIELIQGKTKRRLEVAARQAFARIAINGFGHRVVAVAGLLNKHPNSVSRWISSGRAPEDVEALLTRVLKELGQSIVNSDSATRLFDC